MASFLNHNIDSVVDSVLSMCPNVVCTDHAKHVIQNVSVESFFLLCPPFAPSYSPFVLDQFKRVYSNEDTEQKAIPFLWENFDKEGWSLWRADYKFNDELKRSFMAANLIGGMFQRLDKLHKYAFASVLIFGEDYKLTISGVWLLRGQKLAFDVSIYKSLYLM